MHGIRDRLRPGRPNLYGVYVTAAYLDAPLPLALAHRGGASYRPNAGRENTLEAFANAVDLGFGYIETDVQASRDGIAHVFHDDDTGRLIGRPGRFDRLDAADIARHSVRGARVPTLSETLAAFPDTRFNIDLKSPAVIGPALDAIRAAGAQDRCLLASFQHRTLRRVRALAPEIATSMSPPEVATLRLGAVRRVRRSAAAGGAVAAQVPERRGRLRVVDAGFVRRAHALGLQVHVWTVDDPEDMHRLLDLGVDGLVSDRIDVLKDVLVSRGQWRKP